MYEGEKMFVKFASNLVLRVYRPTFEIAIPNTKERKTYVYARVLVSRNKTIKKEGKITLKHVAPIRNIRSLTLFPKLTKLVGKSRSLLFVSFSLNFSSFLYGCIIFASSSMWTIPWQIEIAIVIDVAPVCLRCLNDRFNSGNFRILASWKMLAWIVLFPPTIRINMLRICTSPIRLRLIIESILSLIKCLVYSLEISVASNKLPLRRKRRTKISADRYQS